MGVTNFTFVMREASYDLLHAKLPVYVKESREESLYTEDICELHLANQGLIHVQHKQLYTVIHTTTDS